MINTLKLIQLFLFALFSITLIGCSSSSGGGGIGNNATATLELSPSTSLDFSTVTQGIASPLEVTITNNNDGNADLNITSMTISGTGSGDFQLDTTAGANPCGLTPLTINGNDSCTIVITFQPTPAGAITATLEIESNDSNSPKQLALTGTGVVPMPSLQVSPTPAFDFGTITADNTALPLEVTITSDGVDRLEVTGIAVSGANASSFVLNANAGATPCVTLSPALDPGTNCTVEVSFDPQQTGTLTASLDVTSNDAGSPEQLALTGISEPVAATLTVKINQVEADLVCPNQTVTAFVSVTDQGDFPIEGLILADFDIQEDLGSAINPTTAPNVAIVNEPVSIALVMDNSSSMSDAEVTEMENQAIEIVNKLGPSDMAEIIKFDKNVVVEQIFTSNKTDLIAAINKDFVGDGTALFDAIQKAVTDVSGQTTERNVVIVITDGNDTQSVATGQDIIDASPTNDIPVYAIALGDAIDTSDLELITAATSAELYEAAVSQNLATIIQQQLSEVLFVDQYVLTYTSTSTGGGTVDLKVTATETGPPILTGFDNRDIARCP